MENKELIYRAEERFAFDLARKVLPKPSLSVWMILIPVIIVFHMYRHQRVMNGRREFIENYLISRTRALEEAFCAVEEGTRPDVSKIVAKAADIPNSAMPAYEKWMQVLTAYFSDLLTSAGASYDELVRSSCRTKTEYLILQSALSRAEKDFNARLKPYITESSPEALKVFDIMEKGSEEIRRRRAGEIYGPPAK